MRERGSGVTTEQMQSAPHGAIYIWCNSELSYPKNLARALHREDLEIRPLSWANERGLHGTRPIVIDHAAWWHAQDEQWIFLKEIQVRQERLMKHTPTQSPIR